MNAIRFVTKEEIEAIWEEHGYLKKIDYNSSLRDLPEKVHQVMYPDGTTKSLFAGSMLIDAGIRDLIFDLNRNGHWTIASCQGTTEERQFDMDRFDPRKHGSAYIAFDSIPSKIRDRLLESGLYVYGDDNNCVSIKERVTYTPSADNPNLYLETPTAEEKKLVLKSTRTFQDRVRKAFDL